MFFLYLGCYDCDFCCSCEAFFCLCAQAHTVCSVGVWKAAEYWISAHPLSVLLALGILIPVKHHQTPSVAAGFKTAGLFWACGVQDQRGRVVRRRQTWRRLFLVIPYVSPCWHESGQQLSCYQAARLRGDVASRHDTHTCMWKDIWEFMTPTSIDMHFTQCIL